MFNHFNAFQNFSLRFVGCFPLAEAKQFWDDDKKQALLFIHHNATGQWDVHYVVAFMEHYAAYRNWSAPNNELIQYWYGADKSRATMCLFERMEQNTTAELNFKAPRFRKEMSR